MPPFLPNYFRPSPGYFRNRSTSTFLVPMFNEFVGCLRERHAAHAEAVM